MGSLPSVVPSPLYSVFLQRSITWSVAMSLSLCKMPAAVKPPTVQSREDQFFSPSIFTPRLQLKALQRHIRVGRATSKANQSPSSVSAELVKEREPPRLHEQQEVDYNERIQQQIMPVADRWRQVHGEDDWVGLLDPMDPVLRSELIRYGEMAQACYDAFDFDPCSIYCGSCKYAPPDMLRQLGMQEHGYDVTCYLHATSNINLPNFFKQSRWPKVWSKNANWIGYVAVSNDEMSKRLGRRDIAIAWRGTVTRLEWVADLMDYLRSVSSDKIPCPDPTVKVESGFLDLYTDKDPSCSYCKNSAREQILAEVNRLVEMYPDEELSITITGHSLGAALAILSAYDIVETGVNVLRDTRAVPLCVFSFSGPRVGNVRFKERLELLGVKVLRVVNVHDIVPKSPGLIFNENVPRPVMKFAEGLPWSYSHVGVELSLDHFNSPFLKPTTDLVCAHNLEALLHLLDGYHGKGRRFALASGRDIALVNKACDFLKEHYCIHPHWRQDENKGMVRDKAGRWVQPQRHIPLLDDTPYTQGVNFHLQDFGLSS